MNSTTKEKSHEKLILYIAGIFMSDTPMVFDSDHTNLKNPKDKHHTSSMKISTRESIFRKEVFPSSCKPVTGRRK